MPAARWTESVPIRATDCTPHGTVSLPALCTVLQNVAGHHAAELGVSMQELRANDQAWALTRLDLDLEQAPAEGDTLTVETWPSGLDGLFATREFLLFVDKAPAVRATSRWFVLDTERRRPTRPPRSLYDLDLPDRPPARPHPTDDLPEPTRTDSALARTVRYPDLDLNGHLNSVRSLTWALRPFPDPLYHSHRCTHVALQFQAEATRGTPVRATVQIDDADEDRTVRHALHNPETDTLLTTARTVWTPRS